MSGPKRGPGVSEAGHRAAIRARQARVVAEAKAARLRLDREAEAEAEVQRIFDEADAHGIDTTRQAIRQALAEQKVDEAAEARARQVERARAIVAPARPQDRSAGPLPGGLDWPKIEAMYRDLAATPAGYRHRRRTPGEPSRPELADALNVSTATLKRACAKAGKGTRWPPAGL